MLQRRLAQQGFVLIALLVLLTMGGLYYFVGNLTPAIVEVKRQQKTDDALIQAREALLGYALRYREAQISDGQYDRVYGYLPLPDLGTSQNNNVACTQEGCDAASNTTNFTVIGRFPWRTLGTSPLRDGNGECLWMAISGSHDRIQRPAPMNWDTPAQIDVVIANGSTALVTALTTKHDRPVAVIFSPGPPLSGQNRSNSTTDSVTECGGNYDANNYIDPATSPAFTGTNNARGNTSAQAKPLSMQGTILVTSSGNFWQNNCPAGSTCTGVVANNKGLAVTGDRLFSDLRKSNLFRTDINAMLDRMTSCLRDIGVGASVHPIATNSCYDDSKDPLGYFTHYQDQIFVGKCTGNCAATIDGVAQTCPNVLIFGGQRSAGQSRLSAALSSGGTDERTSAANYLEEPNLTSFNTGGASYTGTSLFARESTAQPKYQDVLRCIPATESFTAAPSALPAGAELTSYDAATQTLTLGRANIESDKGYAAANLFGCIWRTDANTTGSGFRAYFKFNITNSGDGFSFAAIDGDRNGSTVCGAGQQHLGYSGNNQFTPIINYPKLGVEFDTRRNFRSDSDFTPNGFEPDRTSGGFTFNTLNNGRADPSYTGGHIGIAYWGSESLISTSDGTSNACTATADCRSPSICDAGFCKLEQVEDDNVHGQLPTPPATRPPPQNPAAPAGPPDPPYPPYAVDKLDPSLGSVPTNQEIHVRVEVTRSSHAGRDDNSRLAKHVATAALTSLSDLPTIDGVTVQSGDTVLVTAQTNATQNGLYVASSGTWARTGSADESADLPPGTSWFVLAGATQKGSLWRLQNTEAPTMSIANITIQKVRSPVVAVATTNLALTGLQTVDGVTLAAADRVLLTAQTTASQNGVYAAAAGAWVRSTPEDTAAGMRDGSVWYVTGGTQAGSFWRLNGAVTPGVDNASIALVGINDIHSSVFTTQVWKEAGNADQITRMKITTRSMAQLDPVLRHGKCAASAPLCPSSNPADQSCGGTEVDGFRYCYTGQKPKLYDSKKVYDVRGSSCDSGLNCSANQYCGIDSRCYQTAFRTTRIGFTTSQSTQDQVIIINSTDPLWLP